MTTHIKSQALILFAHGARDPRWAEPLIRVQQLLAPQLPQNVTVHIAFLELMTPTLPDLIQTLHQQNYNAVSVVPIFLGQGGHVRRDLPELIEQLTLNYPHIALTLAPAIGEDERVLNAIAEVCLTQIALVK